MKRQCMNELTHFRIVRETSELYHKDAKKYKYIAKVKYSNNKYRYFYDKEEYQNYLQNKRKSNTTENLNQYVSKNSKKNEKESDSIFDKLSNAGKRLTDLAKKGVKYLNKKKDKTVRELTKLTDKIEKGKNFISKKMSKTLDQSSKSTKSTSNKKEKKFKYIERVTLPNGKYRYFYTKDEWIAYNKRLKYQENDPDFMKSVAHIDGSEVLMADEDMAKINEDYSLFKDERSMNCIYCTTAYELRRRGYNVKAAEYDPENSPYEGNYWGVESWYENADIRHVNPGGTTSDLNKYTDDKNRIYAELKWSSEVYLKPKSYIGYDIEKAILKDNPPNSRGNLLVYWNSGGGHSMAYEVDSSGKVKVRDCQTNTIVNLNDIAYMSSDVSFVRTDNLKLKKGVLDTIENY